jgi:hypothetical protein
VRLDEVSDVNGSVEIDGVVGAVHASTVNDFSISTCRG